MFYTYVLKSFKNGKRYIGYTSKSPEERLRQHNKGCSEWTRKNRPFELLYYEKLENKTEAIKRERYLKTGYGRKFLDNLFPR